MGTHTMREGLPPLPERMRNLPISPRGYPVPFFVAWIDGVPDFRVSDGRKLAECVRFKKCWLCGGAMGAFATFVIGPMCAVNCTSAEPPSHRDCAEYAARACPFLTMPKARRRPDGITEEAAEPAGIAIRRNPGATLVWTTRKFSIFNDSRGGVLFDVGEPLAVSWLSEGRNATREEVEASIQGGLPELAKLARDDADRVLLGELAAKAMNLAPSPTPTGEAFCVCGRRVSDCDGSRKGCRPTPTGEKR